MPPKLFTLEEATSLLPKLEPLVRRLVEIRQALRPHEAVIAGFQSRASLTGGLLPSADLRNSRAKVEQLGAELREEIRRVEALGCVVKDTHLGLVDFLARRGAGEVFLCWRLGEPTIRYWHGLHEGFAGRRPLDE
ncbi:MAG TPA: DUF2203 domain-containing protein [Candidatus Sulfotelmatobacter sp.]|nr:DUF2203 domain-containing protein [Candidatus Sulfotelmatobacter sp.]